METLKNRQIYKNDFTEYLLCLALDVGEGMLKNGGDVNRVEDTIERICRAYGAEHVEVFTIISVINAAVRMPDGTYSSQLRRVKATSNNLGRLERLNALSREVCREKPALEEFDDKLRELKKTEEYRSTTIVAASAIASGAFTLFFGGNFRDALVSMLIGILLALIELAPSLKLNIMARTAVSAFIAAVLSALSVSVLHIADHHGAIMTGLIMLLVPGMAFGTAMRDLFYGDLLAGALKTIQAVLTSLMIAFGYVLAMTMFENMPEPPADISGIGYIIKRFATALVASLAFAVLFRINKKHLISAGAGAFVTYGIYFVFEQYISPENIFAAAIISAVFTAFYAELSARIHKAPALVFLIVGVIPTVPGRYLYNTMRYLVEKNWSMAITYFIDTMQIAIGIAAGVVFVTILWSIISDFAKKQYRKRKRAQKEFSACAESDNPPSEEADTSTSANSENPPSAEAKTETAPCAEAKNAQYAEAKAEAKNAQGAEAEAQNAQYEQREASFCGQSESTSAES